LKSIVLRSTPSLLCTYVYYFKTKEQLFLALQAQQLQEWFADIDARLSVAQDGCPIADVVALICASLAQRPALTRLLAILHTVLKQNVDFATALDFKKMLRAHVTHTGALLEQRLPFLAAGQGAQLLLRITALVIGLQHLADPAPLVRNVLYEPDMQLFMIDFADEFSEMLDALLRGLACAAQARRQP
jgi:AcrR family transcriptional regulator